MKDGGKIMVTGGAGFIGSHLVERLLGEGYDVVVIDDFSTGLRENLSAVVSHPKLQVIESKVSTFSDLPALMAETAFVYHLAAAVGVELVARSPVQTIETNLREMEAVLQAASVCKVPLLFTSSSEVYGKSQKAAFSEEDDLLISPPACGRWAYACSKLMDEFLALAYARERGTPVIITRLFNTVGPRQVGHYGMVLPRFIEAAKAGRPLKVYGDGQQTRCFCYVTDTVEALFRLQNAMEARGEVINVGGREEVTIERLAQMVVAMMRSKSRIEHVPYPAGFDDMLRRKPVTDRLKKVTGFQPQTSLDEIIKKTAGLN